MPSAASAKMAPTLKPMIVYAANSLIRSRLYEQIQPVIVCHVPFGALSTVYVKQRLGSWAPGPYERGVDQPVLKPCIALSCWISDAWVRSLPAARAAAVNTIAAVHACCV